MTAERGWQNQLSLKIWQVKHAPVDDCTQEYMNSTSQTQWDIEGGGKEKREEKEEEEEVEEEEEEEKGS